jgi:hypothetical protein
LQRFKSSSPSEPCFSRAVNFDGEITILTREAHQRAATKCQSEKSNQFYGPQALIVKQQAFNLLNTGQYRGGSPI